MADDVPAEPMCDHWTHQVGTPEPAVWLASTGPALAAMGDLGKWCADHLGDGLDGYDGQVTLTHVASL